jgi:hypothetical protein
MKKFISVISTVAILMSSSAFAAKSCLDYKPRSKAQLQQEIESTEILVQDAEKALDFYRSIYDHSKNTSDLSKLIAAVSVLPAGALITTSFVQLEAAQIVWAWIFGDGVLTGLLMASVPMGATVGVAGVLANEISKLEFSYFTQYTDDDVARLTELKNRKCSYNQGLLELQNLQEALFAGDLKNSLKNDLKDAFTLGSHTKNASYQLTEIAFFRSLLLNHKLKDLKDIKL